jgi:hypothetical protein
MHIDARTWRLGVALLATATAMTGAACGSSKTSTTTSAAAPSSAKPMSMGSATAMAAHSATCGMAGPGARVAVSGGHVFILRVGPPETMYSSQQARRMHSGSGEIMLGGQMAGSTMTMSGRGSMGHMAPRRHLEVHICTRHGNHVVTEPSPTITLTSGSHPEMIPVAEMEGIGQGPKDVHFGNNVQMLKGRRYTVRVIEGRDHVVFHVTPS